MIWNCKKYDGNAIKDYNVLSREKDIIKNLKKKSKDIEEFSEALKIKMMSMYWSRCEYELIIRKTEDGKIKLRPWCGYKNPDEIEIDVTNDEFDWKGFAEFHINRQIFNNSAKIDIYEQLEYRWNEFVEYCWNNNFKG